MSGITPERVRRWPIGKLSEPEWLTCSDPTRMLDFLVAGPASDRKLRLFACACCRRIWPLLPEAGCRDAVGLAERYADGRATPEVLAAAAEALVELCDHYHFERLEGTLDATAFLAYTAASSTTSDDAPRRVPGQLDRYIPARTWAPAGAAAVNYRGATPAAEAEEEAAQCDLLREIFGNPFRPVVVAPEWRSDTVRAIARGVDEEGAFDRLPILGDALQDAGCEDGQVLRHCRGPRPHTRGCWVVDLALARE
jgi:hypothetical protein